MLNLRISWKLLTPNRATQERDCDTEEQDQTCMAGTATGQNRSHGYQVAKSHTSATCNMKKNGHQDAATKIDTMGGVQWGKE
jgi:hypothetical protein